MFSVWRFYWISVDLLHIISLCVCMNTELLISDDFFILNHHSYNLLKFAQPKKKIVFSFTICRFLINVLTQRQRGKMRRFYKTFCCLFRIHLSFSRRFLAAAPRLSDLSRKRLISWEQPTIIRHETVSKSTKAQTADFLPGKTNNWSSAGLLQVISGWFRYFTRSIIQPQ